jgi:hypothetical protein
VVDGDALDLLAEAELDPVLAHVEGQIFDEFAVHKVKYRRSRVHHSDVHALQRAQHARVLHSDHARTDHNQRSVVSASKIFKVKKKKKEENMMEKQDSYHTNHFLNKSVILVSVEI